MQSILMTRGIRISDDDPVFTLLALNELVLEEMTAKHQQTFDEIDQRVVENLCVIVNQTVTQIAGKEAETRKVIAATKNAMWLVVGGLTGMFMFAMGISYGSLYSTWRSPEWIDRTGVISTYSTALLKAPAGGIGCIVIALALAFLQKGFTELIAENQYDKSALKIPIYILATTFAAIGLWLNFLVIFK